MGNMVVGFDVGTFIDILSAKIKNRDELLAKFEASDGDGDLGEEWCKASENVRVFIIAALLSASHYSVERLVGELASEPFYLPLTESDEYELGIVLDELIGKMAR